MSAPIFHSPFSILNLDSGVPDRWEGTGYVYGFTDLNHDGFPDGLTFPEAGGGNFDIEVTVTTSRSALLSWGEGTSKGIVLPPCDGQVIKEVPPGHFPSTQEEVNDAVTYCRNRYILPPPRVSFHVWECGPTNNPPYLWCTVPRTNETGRIYASLMIFFQNRWWFSTWPFVEGEQQW